MLKSDVARAAEVKNLGGRRGFDLVRITGAEPLREETAHFVQWVEAGRAGEMRWLTPERAERSGQPASVLPGAQSVICLAMSYWTGERPIRKGAGRIARYAWGRDYHAVLEERMSGLATDLESRLGGEYRWHVDTGPLMDKALAARAGIGWYGKNTNILTEQFGSFLFLGEILTTVRLAPDQPIERGCGTCRLCSVACPTGAIGPDYSLDARRCISYLTIEHRGSIPLELRPLIGDRVFGCDICQDVCPPAREPFLSPRRKPEWAREVRAYLAGGEPEEPSQASAAETEIPEPWRIAGDHRALDLEWLLGLRHEQYLGAFRGTAIRRAKVWMLRRNAAIALGNVGGVDVIPVLAERVREDEHPIVRGHAAWAIGRIAERVGRRDLRESLRGALEEEGDAMVREEIERVLA